MKPKAKKPKRMGVNKLLHAYGNAAQDAFDRLRQIAEIMARYEPALREDMGPRAALWIRHNEAYQILKLATGKGKR